MNDFDLRKYLAEGMLLKEDFKNLGLDNTEREGLERDLGVEGETYPSPGDKFTIKGDYYIPQPNSKYNRYIGDRGGEAIPIEYVKEASKDEGFFRIVGKPKMFRIPTSHYSRLIRWDGL